MYKEPIRRHIAWGLLAVFAVMMAFTTLHQHHYVMHDDVECVQCTHHQPHSGHFSWQSVDTHNCLVCQLGHTPFLSTGEEDCSWFAFITVSQTDFYKASIVLSQTQTTFLRAPPSIDH